MAFELTPPLATVKRAALNMAVCISASGQMVSIDDRFLLFVERCVLTRVHCGFLRGK